MHIAAIEEALHARPFVPFRFILPSDRAIPVHHPEFVSIAPNRKWILVWKKNSGWNVIEPALVTELSFNRSPKRRAA